MVNEAKLKQTENGLVPEGDGWFVLNAKETPWLDNADFGRGVTFEGEGKVFSALGINISILGPGQPLCMYHGEDEQEDFLILSGEAILLVEGEERPLKQWDFVHCPPWTEHVIVGAGEGPCTLLAVGTRTDGGLIYPVVDVALKHGAGVRVEATTGKVAYAESAPTTFTPYRADLD